MIVEGIKWVPVVVMATSILRTLAVVVCGRTGSDSSSSGRVVTTIRLQLAVVRG